ncbi:ABC transporter permease [candidate division KSB1 bacterium]
MKKQKAQPPYLAKLLLRIFLSSKEFSEFSGDLIEIYRFIAGNESLHKAKLWYWKRVLESAPSIINDRLLWSLTMFKNYLKIAFRNIKRHKGYSFINVMGLALGLACCIFIMLWIFDELSYDRFFENSDRLYRVEERIQYSDYTGYYLATSPAVAPGMKAQFPEISDACRYDPVKKSLVTYKDKMFYESQIVTADQSFLNMFSFKFINGNRSTALSDPRSIVLTRDIAEKYFDKENPLGKTLVMDNTHEYVVNGVIENVPGNTHFAFNIIISFDFITGREGYNANNWSGSYITTYVLLDESAEDEQVDEKIKNLVKDNSEDTGTELYLQPVRDILLRPKYGSGTITNVYVFAILAFLVLLIACINFMNLSTARSANRAKEIGVRKVVGAQKIHIMSQFYGESLFMSFAGLFIAIIVVLLLLPQFNLISGKQLSLMELPYTGTIFLGMFLLMLFTGFIAGSYPALLLSSLKVVRTIRSSFSKGAKNSNFRKVMVVIQFSISIIFVIATVGMKSQLSFIQNMERGWEKDHLLYINISENAMQKYEIIKDELTRNSEILGVTLTRQIPSRFGNSAGDLRWEGKNPEQSVSVYFNPVDYDFTETFKISMAEGRPFSEDFPSDLENAALINSEFAGIMSGESVVGKPLWFGDRQLQIIGVMEDFHIQSARSTIKPALFYLDPFATRYMFVRIRPENMASTMSFMQDTWKTYLPDFPMEYSFMDEYVERIYSAETHMSALLNYLAVLAIFIACLGLFGLSAYMAEQRIKEIGIRKVYGASVKTIVYLLVQEIVKWIMIAALIAFPIAWFTMNNWLQDFAFRIDLSIWPFIAAGIGVLVIALITVSFQSIKAALSNPIESLKYE